ncbi:cysteine hydrolase family protein [Streptomyces sp. NPDC086091]|uniref:cysteine hydrolase family protein n=1 Tax=Streptomyces sp. NPDC086091 TaxID=3365751 RepID=UPI0037FE3CD7
MTGRTRTALVVVDLQNDFCAGPTARARFGGAPARLDAAVAGSVRATAEARRRGVDVVFVRFTGDPRDQGAAWRHRDLALGKRPKCLEGSWGAEFHGVTPAPGEAVFTKRARFDAFLGEGFEDHLHARGIGHLVLAGLYADVCVDSTARTAFQKGFHVTVLTDCTTALHLPYDTVLHFMRTVYGARTAPADDPAVWTSPPSDGTPHDGTPGGEPGDESAAVSHEASAEVPAGKEEPCPPVPR